MKIPVATTGLVTSPPQFSDCGCAYGISATLAEHKVLSGTKHADCIFYPRDLERIAARKKQKLAVEWWKLARIFQKTDRTEILQPYPI